MQFLSHPPSRGRAVALRAVLLTRPPSPSLRRPRKAVGGGAPGTASAPGGMPGTASAPGGRPIPTLRGVGTFLRFATKRSYPHSAPKRAYPHSAPKRAYPHSAPAQPGNPHSAPAQPYALPRPSTPATTYATRVLRSSAALRTPAPPLRRVPPPILPLHPYTLSLQM